jgi:hypothetical protein
MDPQIDTAQRRAEALLLELRQIDKRHADEGIAFVTELLDPIIEFEQQTRRAALEEAKLEIEKCIDYSGGCVGTRNDPHVVAVNRFIELTVGPLLDRLREGVGT